MTTWFSIGTAAGVALVVAVSLALWLHARRRGRVAAAFGDAALLERLIGTDLSRPQWMRIALVLGGVFALAAALLTGRPGGGEVMGGASGRPIVLVIDVSNSMLAEDIGPSRLGWARAAAQSVVGEAAGAPVGIVVFAGRAYALTPPTRDVSAVELYIDALDPGMATQTGSVLAGAIRQGVGLVLAGDDPGGALILMTDGNTEEAQEQLVEAIGLARRAGVRVHIVGVGTSVGAQVPDLDPLTGERRGVLTDASGDPVISRLGDELLSAIARETGGRYLVAGEVSPGQVAALGKVARTGGGDDGGGVPRSIWFAALALILLGAEIVITSGGWIRRLAIVGGVLLIGGCDSGGMRRGGIDAGTDSVAMYRALSAARPGDPLPLYDLGTVLLTRQRFEEARPPLEAAAGAEVPELRQRAHYNLGNSRLEPIFATEESLPEQRSANDGMLRAAAESYKEALRIAPGDMDAKWNLELAQRRRQEERNEPDPPDPPPPDGADGGGGGGSGGGGGGGAGGDPAPAAPEPLPDAAGGGAGLPPMSESTAEELLANARDREIGIQRRALRKPQPESGTSH